MLQRDRTNIDIKLTSKLKWARVDVTVTLSTPALRIKFPFLFHLSANIGPLCWPKVLARFPTEGEEAAEEHVEGCNTLDDRQNL